MILAFLSFCFLQFLPIPFTVLKPSFLSVQPFLPFAVKRRETRVRFANDADDDVHGKQQQPAKTAAEVIQDINAKVR